MRDGLRRVLLAIAYSSVLLPLQNRVLPHIFNNGNRIIPRPYKSPPCDLAKIAKT
jgi:hypothetical protein